METGVFEKPVLLTPDYCSRSAAMSPLAAFTIFQGIASEHAELIGVGGAAMAKRGEFWLTVHSRVDFYDIRCFRGYRLTRGEKLIARGRTQWAILGPEKKMLRFEQSGFPEDYPFADHPGLTDEPTRFHDDFTEADLCWTHPVRATDIDMGRHVNNVVYIRLLLDCFPAKTLADGSIRSIEAHYASPCLEGETLGVYCRREADRCRMAVKHADGKPAVLAQVIFR